MRRHAGSVVEFNGDGMMAVFGAPQELRDKERAAVEAARDIVAGVRELPFEGAGPQARTLSVGVGIATGPVFVGNIRAVDRLIWSAVGNTTNLAARLEALTRDLDALIVIDEPTRRGASYVAVDFQHRPETPIRGRRDPVDVYVLPIPARSTRARSFATGERSRRR